MDKNSPFPPGEFLYHYTTKKKAIEGILHEKVFRMGKFSETNDPRENKKWPLQFTLAEPPTEHEDREMFATWHEAEELQKRILVLCLTEDAKAIVASSPPEMRGYGLDRMWSQYGEHHGGVCLVFDKEKLSLAVKIACNGIPKLDRAVDYVILAEKETSGAAFKAAYDIDGEVVKSKGRIPAIREHAIQHAVTLLFTKALDWQGESEYRYVAFPEDAEHEVRVGIQQSLAGVIVGVDFPKVYLPLVHNLCESINPNSTSKPMVWRCIWKYGHLDELKKYLP